MIILLGFLRSLHTRYDLHILYYYGTLLIQKRILLEATRTRRYVLDTCSHNLITLHIGRVLSLG